MSAGSRSDAGKSTPPPPTKLNELDLRDRELLEILVLQPGLMEQICARVTPEMIHGDTCRQLYEAFCRAFAARGGARFEDVLLYLEDPRLHDLLMQIDAQSAGKAEHATLSPEQLWQHWWAGEQRRRTDAIAQQELRRLEKSTNEEEAFSVLQKLVEMKRERDALPFPTED